MKTAAASRCSFASTAFGGSFPVCTEMFGEAAPLTLPAADEVAIARGSTLDLGVVGSDAVCHGLPPSSCSTSLMLLFPLLGLAIGWRTGCGLSVAPKAACAVTGSSRRLYGTSAVRLSNSPDGIANGCRLDGFLALGMVGAAEPPKALTTCSVLRLSRRSLSAAATAGEFTVCEARLPRLARSGSDAGQAPPASRLADAASSTAAAVADAESSTAVGASL